MWNAHSHKKREIFIVLLVSCLFVSCYCRFQLLLLLLCLSFYSLSSLNVSSFAIAKSCTQDVLCQSLSEMKHHIMIEMGSRKKHIVEMKMGEKGTQRTI